MFVECVAAVAIDAEAIQRRDVLRREIAVAATTRGGSL